MTYHAGLGIGFGVAPRAPHLTCDDCGLAQPALRPNGQPYAWILSRKAPPGWLLIRQEEPFSRKDYCPRCRDQQAAKNLTPPPKPA